MKMNCKKIKSELERIKWSQQDLATAMGVDRQYVWWALNNENNHTFRTVERFALALNLDPKDLIE